MERRLSGLAHGLGGELAAPDWPRLTEAELAKVLAAYALASAGQVTWHSQRPFAASAIVQAGGGQVFVKRHDPRVRSVADLRQEHAFIAHLRARGVPAPAVLATANGSTAATGPMGTYEVHALGDGCDTYRDAHSWTPARGQADAVAIGRALGTLHEAASGFHSPARRTRLLVAGDALMRADDFLSSLSAWIACDTNLRRGLTGRPWRRELGAALLGWHRALLPHRPGMAPLWMHGDFHASNLLWRDGQVSAVLDFGLTNRASAVFDLATAIERNAVEWLRLAPGDTDIGRADLAQALLRGYDSTRPRPPAEIRALRHVLPLVHVDFALSELAYFSGVTASATNADAAYDDFLLGHAVWFAEADGARFLDALSG